MSVLSWMWSWMRGEFSLGGGGGGGDGGAAEMQKREAERQARIVEAQRVVNRIFQGGGDEFEQVQTGTTRSTRPAAVYTQQVAGGDRGARPPPRQTIEQGAIYDPKTRKYVMNVDTPTYEQKLLRPATTGFNEDFFKKRSQAALDYYNPQLEDQFSKAKEQMTYALAKAGLLRSSAANTGIADLQGQYTQQKADVSRQAQQAEQALRAEVEGQRQSLLAQASAAESPSLSSDSALTAQRNIMGSAPSFSVLGELFKPAVYGYSAYSQGQQDARTRALGLGSPNRSTARTVS